MKITHILFYFLHRWTPWTDRKMRNGVTVVYERKPQMYRTSVQVRKCEICGRKEMR